MGLVEGKVTDRIVGLELGADDYMPKPFEPRALLARVQSILRRSTSPGQMLDVLQFEGLTVNKLRQEGKLKIKDFEDKVTFHDPCYLGRIGGETEAPREVLGGDLIEMERHCTNSFCCGGGGAIVWMEEDADKRVNEIRAKEASKTGADCVAVGCPYCMTMMSDGMKSIGDEKQVKDISEILLENLEAET